MSVFDLGMHTTLTDENSKLDPEVLAFTERITPLMSPNFGAVWNLFTTRSTPFTRDEYEIYNRAYSSPEVTVTASGGSADWDTTNDITALPVSSTTIDRLTIGDVLLVGSEIVVVKDVDRSGNTIDVYERGAGESSAAAHGTSPITAKIIGNAHEEGKVDPEAMAERTAILMNYTQLVEEVVDLSHEDTEQSRKLGRTRDILKQEATERVVEDLARTAIWGVSREPAAGFPSMTRGFLEHLKLASSLKTAVSGAFTEAVLQNALDAVRAAGGTVNAIVMNVRNKRTFNGFTGADQVQVDRGERVGGHVLDGYLADGFGVIPPVVDKDMPNDMIAIVSTRRMVKGWKVGDSLRFVVETNTHSREKKETLQGRFGLAMEGVDKTHYLLTSIT